MSIQKPCPHWQELLAARHPDDLAPPERAALAQHLATCFACSSAYSDYNMLTRRIRALPVPELLPLPQFSTLQQEEAIMQHAQGNEPIPFPGRRSTYRVSPRSRLAGIVNMASIALVMALLIGTSLALFSHRPGTMTGHASIPAAAEPTHLIPQSLGSCLSDAGLDWICTKGYYKLVHITKEFSGPQNFTITINRLYADSNRAVVGFTVLDSHGKLPDGLNTRPGGYAISTSVSMLRGSTSIPLRGETGSAFYGDDQTVPYNPKNFTGMMYATFDASLVPADTGELFTHFKAVLQKAQTTATPQIYNVLDLGTASFDLSMPFHRGYTFYPHPIVTEYGLDDFKIDHVTVSLSQVVIVATAKKALDLWRTTAHSLTLRFIVDGVIYYDTGVSFPSTLDVPHLTRQVITSSYALAGKKGIWQLQIKLIDSATGKVIQNGTYQFTNPGQ